MRTYLITFALSLFIALVLTPTFRDWAIRRKWVDAPDNRKIHKSPIPRLGGVAVLIALIFPLCLLPLWDNRISRTLIENTALIQALGIGIPIIAFVGVIDDIRGIRAIYKLFAQIAAASSVYISGIAIKGVSIPFFLDGPLMFPAWLSLAVTVFWIVLVINAINLIDGMDGLAGSVVALAGVSLFIMSSIEGNIVTSLLLIALVGSTLGFLVYNLNPASIFLGDTGSMFLGFVLAVAAVDSSQKSYTLFSMLAAMMVLGLPIFDLSMAVVRRFLSGKNIFRADQHHIHHILLRRGFSQRQSMRMLIIAALGLETLAFASIYADDRLAAISILAIVPLAFVAVRLLGYQRIISKARRTRIFNDLGVKSQGRMDAIESLEVELSSIADFSDLTVLLENSGKTVGWVAVRIVDADAEAIAFSWPSNRDDRIHISDMKTRTYLLKNGLRFEIDQLNEDELLGPMDQAFFLLVAKAFETSPAIAG